MAWTTLARLARDGAAERVSHGVYRLAGVPVDDRIELRAAWLQLAPDTPVWERTASQGVVSHRSAARSYRLGHLSADTHQFTLPVRRQSRRTDVHIYCADVGDVEWADLDGLLVTSPARIAADLLADREDPEAVAHVIADALRADLTHPAAVAPEIARFAARFRLADGDGIAFLDWLLELAGAPERAAWLAAARESTE
jgi:hypothetical protein